METTEEEVITKKILNAQLTEADYFRFQYNDETCMILLYNEKLNRVYATGLTKEDAANLIDMLSAFIGDVPTVDLRKLDDNQRMYG